MDSRQLPLEAFAVTRGVAIEMDMNAVLEDHVFGKADFAQELLRATEFVQQACVCLEPRAETCSDRPVEELKAVAARCRGSPQQCLFAGTLGMLDLRTPACPDRDLSRIRWALKQLTSPDKVVQLLNGIVINASMWGHPEKTALQRVTHDAEVDAIVLAIFWHRNDAQMQEAFQDACRNIVLSCEERGTGTECKVENFLQMELEEEKRNVMGQSAWRKCRALADILQQARAERKGAGQSDAELVATLLGSKKALQSWNKDTVSRYLTVGKRLSSDEICILLENWEFAFGRSVVVDGIMALRGVVAAGSSDQEVERILKTLFWEQVCGLRVSAKTKYLVNQPVHLFRAVLLRQQVYEYCRMAFPQHAEIMQEFGTAAFYMRRFGMSEEGRLIGGTPTVDSDKEEEEEPAVDVGPSSYLSKPLLLSFLERLALNKFEPTLVALTRESGSSTMLDLTNAHASLLASTLKQIKEASA